MTLVILTGKYPHQGEVFLNYELPILCKYFKRIELIPITLKKREINMEPIHMKGLPQNVTYRKDLAKKVSYSVHLSDDLWKSTFKELPRSFRPKAFLKLFHRSFRAWSIYKILREEYLKHSVKGKIIFYSYWLNYGAIALSLLKKDIKNALMISRAHGTDIFHEASPGGYNPFIGFILNGIDFVFSVSEIGRKYLTERYGHADKIHVSRLGVPDPGVLNQPSNDGIFRIVSCSSLIPIKRVDLIIKALSLIGFPVEWVHFGGGPLERKLKNLAHKFLDRKDNIKWVIKGFVPNEIIHDHYRNKPVDVFITTSRSEGIPVSAMEAVSYGIPIIAFDVGGIREIVTKDSGILIPKFGNIDNVVSALEKIREDMIKNYSNHILTRKKVKNFWRHMFNASVNFALFAEEILKRSLTYF